MDVNFAFLCDYADQSGRKLTAIGIGFDTIYAKAIPAAHPLMFAVISLRFGFVEIGPIQIGIRLIDADGNNIIPPLDTTLNVELPPSGYNFRTQRVALALQNLKFAAYGDYTVNWLVGGQEVAHATVKVAPPPAPPTTA